MLKLYEFEVSVASNVMWADEAHTAINADLVFVEQPEEVYPFTASMLDPEVHGKVIFEMLRDEVFGPVAEYIAPPSPPEPQGEEQ